MIERKVFAGGRLRRARARLGLSQTQMAAALSLSPSYLNLIERDQRPLTVQVLLKLAAVYGIEAKALAGDDSVGAAEALKEIFTDPLLAGEIASPAELLDFADAAPNAARGMTRLYAAWRETLERLSDLSQRLASDGDTGAEAPAFSPQASAARWFEEAGPWFPELERAAEEFSARLAPRDDPAEALKMHLREAHGIDVRNLPRHVMPVEQARYDRHSQRLFLAESVPLAERPFLLARQIAMSGFRELLDGLTQSSGLAESESLRVCRAGFVNRLAAAMLAPAARLSEAAREPGADVIRLAERFRLRPTRVMLRLAALGGGGDAVGGFPQGFALVLDASGAALLKIPGAGFPFPRFGPPCARLPLFDMLPAERPLVAELLLPDGAAFLVVAIAEEGGWTPEFAPPRRLAMIGWRKEEAREIARKLPGGPTRPIGVTCRLCERMDCAHRLYPPVTRPAAFHENVVGPSDYELAG